jgi:hypothetical protein
MLSRATNTVPWSLARIERPRRHRCPKSAVDLDRRIYYQRAQCVNLQVLASLLRDSLRPQICEGEDGMGQRIKHALMIPVRRRCGQWRRRERDGAVVLRRVAIALLRNRRFREIAATQTG